MLRTLIWQKKYYEAMSDEHPDDDTVPRYFFFFEKVYKARIFGCLSEPNKVRLCYGDDARSLVFRLASYSCRVSALAL